MVERGSRSSPSSNPPHPTHTVTDSKRQSWNDCIAWIPLTDTHRRIDSSLAATRWRVDSSLTATHRRENRFLALAFYAAAKLCNWIFIASFDETDLGSVHGSPSLWLSYELDMRTRLILLFSINVDQGYKVFSNPRRSTHFYYWLLCVKLTKVVTWYRERLDCFDKTWS